MSANKNIVWETDLRLFGPEMLKGWSLAMVATWLVMMLILGIVFVAQGEPPYRLQFGDSFQDRPGALAYTTLVPPNGAPAEPGQAAVNGRLRSEAASWLGRVGHLHWRKLALWAVLLGGVGLMLWMVLRLGKQTGR